MADTKGILHDMFTAYQNSDKAKAEQQASSRMELAGRKTEYEEHLNKMWDNYRGGNVRQIIEYNRQLNYIKSLGCKVYRNEAGIHKIVIC